jgi:hypothetical protein
MAEKQPSDEGPAARTRIEMSDDEHLDRFKTRTRLMQRGMWGLFGFIMMIAAVAFSGHAAWLASSWAQVIIVAVVAALFVYVFVMIGKHYSQSFEAGSPRLMYQRMDSHQRRWRQAILLNVVTMFIVVMTVPGLAEVLRNAPQVRLLLGAVIAGIVLLMAFMLSVGAGRPPSMVQPGGPSILDDEFDRALRARTMRFGYLLVILLLVAVLQVALWQPDLTVTAIVWALYAGFAGPALYYLIADWRASRGNEG